MIDLLGSADQCRLQKRAPMHACHTREASRLPPGRWPTRHATHRSSHIGPLDRLASIPPSSGVRLLCQAVYSLLFRHTGGDTARICNGSVIFFSPLCARSSRGGAQILMLYAHAQKVTQQKLRREPLPLCRARGGGRLPVIDLLCRWYPVRLERCRSGRARCRRLDEVLPGQILRC
jgi:hypothetical protein